MAVINQFVAAFNRGDTKAETTLCASPTSIIDDFPPHEWEGPTACADWVHALSAENARDGVTNGVVTLGEPWHVNVNRDRGYVVVPATYSYKLHGKPTTERNSIFTVALRKFSTGWRITGWAWSQH
jgi:SnoaL-like domain